MRPPRTSARLISRRRNRPARDLFAEAIVSNQTAVAVVPRQEVRPYFEAVLGAEIAHPRKRRALLMRLRYFPPDAVVIADLPEVRRVGRSCRTTYQTPRRRKLSSDQEAAVALAARVRPLREVASEYGISPELVRLIVKRARPISSAPRPTQT